MIQLPFIGHAAATVRPNAHLAMARANEVEGAARGCIAVLDMPPTASP
jgi:hypothetical protein